MNLYIIRHGQSKENEGTSYSDDTPLTTIGREQAARTGAWLATLEPRPTGIFASPALRTLETASRIQEAFEFPVQIDRDLCENGLLYADDGLSGDDIRARFGNVRLPPEFPSVTGWAADVRGETKPSFLERVERTIAHYISSHPPGSPAIALVTHAHFGGFLLGRLLDIPPKQLSVRRIRQVNCGVTRIELTPEFRVMHFANGTAHLGESQTPG